MFFIPCVSLVFAVMMALEIARCFGKDLGFAIGLILLGPVFLPILALGDARDLGPAGGSPAAI